VQASYTAGILFVVQTDHDYVIGMHMIAVFYVAMSCFPMGHYKSWTLDYDNYKWVEERSLCNLGLLPD